MAAAMRKVRKGKEKVGAHFQEELEKIREKPSAEPFGKALATGANIVTCMDGLVPGTALLGGALGLGASLLNPDTEPATISDLQEDLAEIKQLLKESTQPKTIAKALQMQQKELQRLIDNPVGELQNNFEEIKLEMKNILKNIKEQNSGISDEISTMKDMVSQTYLLVADIKYQVYFHIHLLTINCYLLFIYRIQLRRFRLLMWYGQKPVLLNLKISSSFPLSFRPLQNKTLPESAYRNTSQ